MKWILAITMAALCVGGLFFTPSVKAVEQGYIYGTVTYEGTQNPVTGMGITFTREGTTDSIRAYTNANGQYVAYLANFANWQPGNHILIVPDGVIDYFVCHAQLVTSSAVQNHQYLMNFFATQLPHPEVPSNYWVYSTGGMYVHNHQWADYNFLCVDNEQIQVPYKVNGQITNGVLMAFTPCYFEDGSRGTTEDVSIYYKVEAKYNDGSWGDSNSKEDHTTLTYHYVAGVNAGNNAHNLLTILYTDSQLIAHNIDFRITQIHCTAAGDSTDWTAPPQGQTWQVTNVNFYFTQQG